MKRLLFLFFVGMLTFHAYPQQFLFEDNVTISEPVRENMYVAGGNVTVNTPIEGDLVIAGGTITVNDTVTQDVLLVGGTVLFNSFVGGDIRCAGGSVHIAGDVGGDVVTGSGKIQIDDGAKVGGSLLIGGGEVLLNGIVEGMVKAAAGEFNHNGQIDKDMDCRAGRIEMNGKVGGNAVLAAETIEIGTGAEFDRDVRYWSSNKSLDFKGSVRGKATYDPDLKMETARWEYLGFASGMLLVWYLAAALLMIFIVQYLFRRTLQKAAVTARDHSLKSIGFGFLYFLVVPVGIVLAFITLIGIPVGVLLLLGYIVLLLLASVITAGVGAHWIDSRYSTSNWKTARLVFVTFGIFILLKLISLIPVIGFAIALILACIAFGSILLNINWKKTQAS